jgi:NAD(P)H-hydrate epimerase
MPTVAAGLLEAMWIPLPDTTEGTISSRALDLALASAKGKEAVVLGPGISTHEETRRFVLGFMAESRSPILVDADGLNNLGPDIGVLERVSVPVVLTPHPGEMARLVGSSVAEIQSTRVETARKFALHYNCVVVLKGHRTVIADTTGACHVNPTGNSGMATGGTGDVLSGVIGGLLAQGCQARDAALVGVYLHGSAGDIAAEKMTERGMIARDVLAGIPEAWRRLEGG